MKIARVFPTKNSMLPDDDLSFSYQDDPRDLFFPNYDEVHISCTFTWDIPKAKELVERWSDGIHKVKLGGGF